MPHWNDFLEGGGTEAQGSLVSKEIQKPHQWKADRTPFLGGRQVPWLGPCFPRNDPHGSWTQVLKCPFSPMTLNGHFWRNGPHWQLSRFPSLIATVGKRETQSSFCIWTVSVNVCALEHVQLPCKACRLLCTLFNFNPFEKRQNQNSFPNTFPSWVLICALWKCQAVGRQPFEALCLAESVYWALPQSFRDPNEGSSCHTIDLICAPSYMLFWELFASWRAKKDEKQLCLPMLQDQTSIYPLKILITNWSVLYFTHLLLFNPSNLYLRSSSFQYFGWRSC